MRKLEIHLLKSVNDIAFGTDRNVVRQAFGGEYTEFKKSKYSKTTTDDYGDFHLFYSVENTLEAIEIFPGTNVIVDGKEIYLECPAIVDWVQQIDPDSEQDNDGIISKKMSIGVYAPHQEFETILFGREDYYC